MDKCEGCPMRWLEETGDYAGDQPIVEWECPAVAAMINCPLTEQDKKIIEAMLVGEWNCETCGERFGCRVKNRVPCAKWLPMKSND